MANENAHATTEDGLRTFAIGQTIEEMERFKRKLLSVENTLADGRWNGSGPEVRACKRSMTDLKLQLKSLWAAFK
jgi:hypothetical protein